MSDCPSPLFLVRAAVREARRRILRRAQKLPRYRRQDLVRLARRELAAVEPLLLRAVRDGQLLAWLQAGQDQVRSLPATKPGDEQPAENRGTRSQSVAVASSASGRTPPPRYPLLPDPPGNPMPAVRFPQIERAAQYIRDRLAYTPQEFAQLDADAREVAFTVVKATSLDAVEKIRIALAEDVAHGGSLRAFRETVRDAMDKSALADHQVESLYRTHVARAYSAGQIDVGNSPMVADEFPYLLFDFVHDARVRPEHAFLGMTGLDKTGVYRRDDPFWRTWYPPCGYNCRCAAVPLSLEDAARRGVREAKEWLRTGIPPANPEWVSPPPFDPPKGWAPVGPRLRPAI